MANPISSNYSSFAHGGGDLQVVYAANPHRQTLTIIAAGAAGIGIAIGGGDLIHFAQYEKYRPFLVPVGEIRITKAVNELVFVLTEDHDYVAS